jgi:glycogen debranching enzyme
MDFQEEAKQVLDANWRDGYTIPSARLYPFQWNWDSGFIALGLACHRPERAIEEIRSMFAGQWANGMLPHIVFHKPDPNYFPGPDAWQTARSAQSPRAVQTSGITQPPVFAFVVERIAALAFGKTAEWRAFEGEIYPKILAFHRYLYTFRDPHDEGLAYIQHNWEAGTDNSPAYDAALDALDVSQARDVSALRRDLGSIDAAERPTNANYQRYVALMDLFIRCDYDDAKIARESPFLIQDVLFNSLLAKSNDALIAIARRLGEPTAQIEAWQAKTRASIRRKFWDADRGFYYSWDLRRDRRIPVKTSSGLMPLFAGVCEAEQAQGLAAHLATVFARDDGWKLCASVAFDEAAFDARKYWRGPIWVNVNWMLHHGLVRYGFDTLAARVRRDTLALVETHGWFEYFDARPLDQVGAAHGLGADKFSWSASLLLDFLNNPAPL